MNLGLLLSEQKQTAEAEAAHRKAVDLQPSDATAHCHLGFTLRIQGRFTEALEALLRGHELGLKTPGWPHPSDRWVRETQRLVELDNKIPRILRGDEPNPRAPELIELAQLCQQYKHHYAAAARFYTDAFTAEPKLAGPHLYNAACFAAMAGCGQGKDANALDEEKRARLRGQALAWLRPNIKASTALLEASPEKAAAVQQTLQNWQTDANLSGVRDANALAKLPEGERKQWQQLWDDVAALRKRAQESK